MDVGRQLLADHLDLALDRRGDVERVGLRLADDAETDRGLALKAHDLAVVLGADREARDVVELDRAAFDRGDHDLAELLGGGQLADRLDRQLAPRSLDPSGRNLDVAAGERRLDVRHRQLLRGQTVVVDPHAHRVALLARDQHLGDARELRQTVLDARLRQRRDLDLAALRAR